MTLTTTCLTCGEEVSQPESDGELVTVPSKICPCCDIMAYILHVASRAKTAAGSPKREEPPSLP